MTKILQGQPVLKPGLEPSGPEQKVERCSNYIKICQSDKDDKEDEEEEEEEEDSISRDQPEGQNVYLIEGMLFGSIVKSQSKMKLNLCLLTFRRLMSYIYGAPFLMFLDHTQRRSTVGRTPLDE